MAVRELLLGAGSDHRKKIIYGGNPSWSNLTTLDVNPDHKPDVLHDLTSMPLPFEDSVFDEIHAYCVLEHVGAQGDYRFFFAQWSEFWRILKPGGVFLGISPHPTSPWAWGDPGHTRIIAPESFVFLRQTAYTEQVGVTPMTDYRFVYQADFETIHLRVDEASKQMEFGLGCVKPARI